MAKLTPPRGYAPADMAVRRRWLIERTGHAIPDFALDEPEDLKGLIENHVGYVPIPMSVAGPLKIDGSYAQGEFYVPLCTLEGTLSLSMTRGCYLTYLAGGIRSRYVKQELSRAPAFIFDDIGDALEFNHRIDNHFTEIKSVAESTTKHGKLLRIDKHPVHNRVILDFIYTTGDAAGQNMVTIATDTACRHIIKTLGNGKPFRYLVESNFCSDKNPAYRGLIKGRGHHVICSFQIPDRLLKKLLRVSAEDILVSLTDKHLGSQMAGVLGMNLHTANALAALYLALGQDVACVAENALGIVTYEPHGNDLYATMSMPSLTIGTVGGATRLTQQHSNLNLLGCTGPNSAKKLSEIICAATLALEISLAGAIVSNEFAAAHAQFGR